MIRLPGTCRGCGQPVEAYRVANDHVIWVDPAFDPTSREWWRYADLFGMSHVCRPGATPVVIDDDAWDRVLR